MGTEGVLSSGPGSGSQDPDLLLLLFPAEDAQLKCLCVTTATDSTSVLDVGAVDATWEKIAEYISEYSLAVSGACEQHGRNISRKSRA